MNKTVSEIFKSIKEFGVYQRVYRQHPLDIYIGLDINGEKNIALITNKKPLRASSSKSIKYQIAQRKDGKWVSSLHLVDLDKEEMFCILCNDIIYKTKNSLNEDIGIKMFVNRYVKWRKMFEKGKNSLLSDSVIKGLLGEMIYMKEVLFDKEGQGNSIKSWLGPEHTDQDFILSNKWVEVKTTTSGTSIVKISSVEQLDNSNSGELVVIYLDKTSQLYEGLLSLNKYIAQIRKVIENEKDLERFEFLLFDFGYVYREEYDLINFELKDIIRYRVTKEFPSMKRSNLPNSVINAVYELSLTALSDYIVDTED